MSNMLLSLELPSPKYVNFFEARKCNILLFGTYVELNDGVMAFLLFWPICNEEL